MKTLFSCKTPESSLSTTPNSTKETGSASRVLWGYFGSTQLSSGAVTSFPGTDGDDGQVGWSWSVVTWRAISARAATPLTNRWSEAQTPRLLAASISDAQTPDVAALKCLGAPGSSTSTVASTPGDVDGGTTPKNSSLGGAFFHVLDPHRGQTMTQILRILFFSAIV